MNAGNNTQKESRPGMGYAVSRAGIKEPGKYNPGVGGKKKKRESLREQFFGILHVTFVLFDFFRPR